MEATQKDSSKVDASTSRHRNDVQDSRDDTVRTKLGIGDSKWAVPVGGERKGNQESNNEADNHHESLSSGLSKPDRKAPTSKMAPVDNETESGSTNTEQDRIRGNNIGSPFKAYCRVADIAWAPKADHKVPAQEDDKGQRMQHTLGHSPEGSSLPSSAHAHEDKSSAVDARGSLFSVPPAAPYDTPAPATAHASGISPEQSRLRQLEMLKSQWATTTPNTTPGMYRDHTLTEGTREVTQANRNSDTESEAIAAVVEDPFDTMMATLNQMRLNQANPRGSVRGRGNGRGRGRGERGGRGGPRGRRG